MIACCSLMAWTRIGTISIDSIDLSGSAAAALLLNHNPSTKSKVLIISGTTVSTSCAINP